MRKNQLGITRMNLEHLKTFHVVASLGSFTEAAKALYMTQPAVSQQIQGIEHALRNPLFDRSKRQIRLTLRAKSYLVIPRNSLEFFAKSKMFSVT